MRLHSSPTWNVLADVEINHLQGRTVSSIQKLMMIKGLHNGRSEARQSSFPNKRASSRRYKLLNVRIASDKRLERPAMKDSGVSSAALLVKKRTRHAMITEYEVRLVCNSCTCGVLALSCAKKQQRSGSYLEADGRLRAPRPE